MGIILNHLSYVYGAKTSYEIRAIDDIVLKIDDGEFIGLIGHTGSGKSTLAQHLNGLLKATDGELFFNGENIYEKGYDLRSLRFKVGLVFQYPEHQLFEETVFKDVCFGPKNMGLGKKETELTAFDALQKVHLPDKYYFSSPFELSGGQKRCVAIAGVLAMKPEVLVLDEPTAGLDPQGRKEILELIRELNHSGTTVILISHSMEDVADFVGRIVVMNRGRILMDGTPGEVFRRSDELEEVGLSAPRVTRVMKMLKAQGFDLRDDLTTTDEAAREILRFRSLFGGAD